MRHDLTKLYHLLTPLERKLGIGVVLSMVVAAALQALTAASLYPLLSIASNPAALTTGWLGRAYHDFAFTDKNEFLAIAGGVVLALVLISNASLMFAKWAQFRFQWRINDSLSVRLFRSYLARDYSFFLEENTAELNQNILTEAWQIASNLVQPALTMVSSGALALAMMALLLVVNPAATVLVLLITGGGYGAAYYFIRRRLSSLGVQYADADRQRYLVTAEAFGGIKGLRLLGREAHVLKAFGPASQAFSSTQAARALYASLPKYVVEALAMGSLLAVLVLLLVTGRPVSLVVPIMGTFAFAGYRMAPAFRDVLAAMASFRFTEEIFGGIENALALEAEKPQVAFCESRAVCAPLMFERAIKLKRVGYRYPGTRAPALRDISLTIRRNEAVAFAGRTGAGKTTIVDLILALLSPTEGCILVDGIPITDENARRWRRNLGYVPQEIYLADTSVRRNIAYALPESEIDEASVIRAARIAHIHDFIECELSEGYETLVGERGVRLSGGQRQRIGIARALYHDPSVLVLDEATSDIDGATEASITGAIGQLHGQKTLIVVAHRLQTIRHCDRIYLVENGTVVEEGNYDDLTMRSELFQALAGESGRTVLRL